MVSAAGVLCGQLIKIGFRRRGDLYGNRSVFSRAKKIVKAIQGVENVYTQHTPLLTETIRQLSTNDLSHQSYPYASEVGVSKLSAPKQGYACIKSSFSCYYGALLDVACLLVDGTDGTPMS